MIPMIYICDTHGSHLNPLALISMTISHQKQFKIAHLSGINKEVTKHLRFIMFKKCQFTFCLLVNLICTLPKNV